MNLSFNKKRYKSASFQDFKGQIVKGPTIHVSHNKEVQRGNGKHILDIKSINESGSQDETETDIEDLFNENQD